MRRPHVERCWIALLCLAVGWFDLWTVRSTGEPWKFGKEQRDYYNLLVDGWLDGQLHMKVDVPDALRALADPYDPKARPPGLALHDASFYRGKYFLYFGAAPVVTLMLPFRLLTGIDLPQPLAVLLFVYGAFLASVTTFLAIRRRYFPETGAPVALAGVLALGLAALGPVLLRRPQVWELPIAAGYCFAMLTLLCLWRSLHAGRAAEQEEGGSSFSIELARRSRAIARARRRRAWWFAAAAVCLGLAIASRPTYLVAIPLLLLPLVAWWREERRVPWRPALGAAAPLVAIGVLMAWHNQARFDDPLEFGQAYQFSFDREGNVQHFSPRFVPYNLRMYFWAPATWSRSFPFIEPGELPAKPPGFGQHANDRVFGLLTNLPLAWFALAAPLALRRRAADERRRLRAWLGCTTILFSTVAVLLAVFFSFIARYMLDFTPALMLLAVVGMLGVERAIGSWSGAVPRLIVRGAWMGAAVFSAVFGVLFSLQLNGLFRELNPVGYATVERALNRVPAFLERMAAVPHGSWEMVVGFPRGRAGSSETLLTLGDPPNVDRVFVRYVDDTHVQLGFARHAMPEAISSPIAVEAAQPHRVAIALGGMLPPPGHAWFEEMSPDAARLASRVVWLQLDGKTVVQTFRRFEETGSRRVRAGRQSLGDMSYPRFSGEVRSARRRSLEPAVLMAHASGPRLLPRTDTFELMVKFPLARVGKREPLVCSGDTGQGDILGVEYLDGGHVQFFLDHWGSPLLRSEKIAVDMATPHALTIRLTWLGAGSGAGRERSGEVRLALDGTAVWQARTPGYHADPEEVALGENRIGGSHCGPSFTGTILRTE